MISLWTQLFIFCLCLVVLLTQTTAVYVGSYGYDQPEGEMSDMSDIDEFVKRARGSGVRAVPFPCNGHDHLARCRHGGKGPRKTWTKAGRFCVCLCLSDWVGPECGYSADSLKKRYPWTKTKRISDDSSWNLAGYLDDE